MKIVKSKIFLICCLAFVVGIAIASFFSSVFINYKLWFFAGVIFSIVLIICFWQNLRIRKIGFIGLFLFLGIWRFVISFPALTPENINYFNNQNLVIQGIVINEPDIREKNQKLEIETHSVLVGTGLDLSLPERDVSGKILITTNLYPEYNYGEKLEINCQLEAPEEFNGFAYNKFLARYNIYSVCYYPGIKKLEENQGNKFVSRILRIKNKARDIINRGLDEPEASLGRAIMLGDKRGIPEDLREVFSRVGISHIVAISGMHISILAALVMSFFLGIGLKRKYAFYFASIFLVSYIFLIGMPASAMRAGLMGFLVLWALHLGRLNKINNALILAGAVLLFINPKLLRSDIGFQLSFLAVWGIVYIFPWLDEILERKKIPKLKGIRDIFVITVSAQILTLPVLVINFGVVSIIAPIANLLILWTLPFLMMAMLIGLGLSIILPAFSLIYFLPAKLIINYIIFMASFLEKLPYSYINIDYLWVGWVVIYILVFLYIWWKYMKIAK